MPIRINLLAEAQVAAEQRRKDPVKRGIWIGGFLVAVVLIWIGSLQWDVMTENHRMSDLQAKWKEKNPAYTSVTNQEARISQIESKIAALDTLSTNRFLWGPVLNALQKTMVDHVQVTRLAATQTLTKEDARTITVGTSKKIIPGAEIEKVTLSLEAKDLKPSDQSYNKFKDSLGSGDFFVKKMGHRDGFVMDGVLGPLTQDPVDTSRQFVTFTLAFKFPEVRHSE